MLLDAGDRRPTLAQTAWQSRVAARCGAPADRLKKERVVPISFVLDLADEAATARLAEQVAARARRGDVIALAGPLGSGKTSFARAFIRALGASTEEVPSPTFTLVEVYAFAAGPTVWHFDLFRLRQPEEALELGIEEAFAEAISLIEWPERLGPLLPAEHLRIELAPGRSSEARVVTLTASPSWAPRLAGLMSDG
jgi:tRNA threonylcarbamoyladenosine biosynthesis protein TsaE